MSRFIELDEGDWIATEAIEAIAVSEVNFSGFVSFDAWLALSSGTRIYLCRDKSRDTARAARDAIKTKIMARTLPDV